jgi:hypothetical protein
VTLRIFFDERDRPEEAAALRALALPADAFVLGIDVASPADAVAELIAARRAGRPVAVYAVLADPLEVLMQQINATIAQHPDAEQRMSQIKALREDRLTIGNNVKPWQAAPIGEAQRNAANLLLKLADIVLVGSNAERWRWIKIIGHEIRRFAYLPVVPLASSGGLVQRVTVFAPSTPRAALQPLERRLADRHIDHDVISLENRRDTPRGHVVIAPEWWRPMRALAIAAGGRRVVAPAHGADERSAGVLVYAHHDYLSLNAAIDAARDARAPIERASIPPERAIEVLEATRPALTSGPLVSIVVRTYDRPEFLQRAIASIAAQTYADIEIVVVNNGGPDVRELVERAAAGRTLQYLTMPERKHIGAASNVGARAATGTYVGYLDDDDLLYADHVARAASALERERADFVYTNSVAEYAEMDGDAKRVLGFQVYLDRGYEPEDMYVANVAPIHSIVHRRDAFERFGYFDETLTVTDDWEMWLRVSRGGGRILHIDHATCEYSWRFDPARGNMTLSHQHEFAEFYAVITERYAADVADRPSIRQIQAASLAQQRRKAADLAAAPERLREIVLERNLATAVASAPVPEP